MHRLFHDYFWIYIVAAVVLVGATSYFMPKLMRRLEKIIERRLRDEKKNFAKKSEREAIPEKREKWRQNINSEKQ